MKKTIIELIRNGADTITIGQAAAHSELTCADLQQMNAEHGLAFTYESAADTLTVTRE